MHQTRKVVSHLPYFAGSPFDLMRKVSFTAPNTRRDKNSTKIRKCLQFSDAAESKPLGGTNNHRQHNFITGNGSPTTFNELESTAQQSAQKKYQRGKSALRKQSPSPRGYLPPYIKHTQNGALFQDETSKVQCKLRRGFARPCA